MQRRGSGVPEGRLKIAQINAGNPRAVSTSPEGTAEAWWVQPSLRDLDSCRRKPGVETPGYFQNVLSGQKWVEIHLRLRALKHLSDFGSSEFGFHIRTSFIAFTNALNSAL